MASLREYFDTDFTHVLNVAQPLKIQFEKSPKLEIQARLHLDFTGNAKYISCFLPAHPVPIAALVGVLEQIGLILESAKQVEVHAGFVGERPVHCSELAFTGRVYFYSESEIPSNDFENLRKQALANGLSICLRAQSYTLERSRLEKPLAFICHDFRDKVQVARPIAIGRSKGVRPLNLTLAAYQQRSAALRA
jgi:hypothetical protein